MPRATSARESPTPSTIQYAQTLVQSGLSRREKADALPNPNPWSPFSSPRGTKGGFESPAPRIQGCTNHTHQRSSFASSQGRTHEARRDVGSALGADERLDTPGAAPLLPLCVSTKALEEGELRAQRLA